MARTDPQVNIRMPEVLKGNLQESAFENGRSLNAEIVHRLEMSFLRETAASEGAVVATIPALIDEANGELLIREIADRIVERVFSEDEMERFQALQNKKKPK
ncbi:Arc family DNA-binding protein [Chromobacterium sp.]|uniref:Arc family DNA-binding protein n=1 Tax=Chromobacterium sp. TaxID=306190 RepID=UPI0035AED272